MRFLLLWTAFLIPNFLHAADWPQWMGPNRDGSSPEKGLLTTWPKTGPKVLWKVAGGDGYSSIAVVGDQAFTLIQRGGEELAIALDARTGATLWTQKVGPAFKNNYGNGPRSTPAVDGDLVYVQSVSGPLLCLKRGDGSVVWQHDILKEYMAKNITWGLSASPVIDDDLVLVLPGAKGAGVAAFDKKTGKLAWKTGSDKAAYASPTIASVSGQKQYLFFNAAALLAVSPKDGKELWRVAWPTEFDCNICTPLVLGEKCFVSSGEENGGVFFQLASEGPPKAVWESKGKKSVMLNYWANAVHHDGHLYGLSGEFSGKIHLNCVDANTGKLVWSQKEFGKGAITLADGHLFVTTKAGDVLVIPASPEGYQEKGRVKLLGDNRTVPTISGGRLFLRDREQIVCLDIMK